MTPKLLASATSRTKLPFTEMGKAMQQLWEDCFQTWEGEDSS